MAASSLSCAAAPASLADAEALAHLTATDLVLYHEVAENDIAEELCGVTSEYVLEARAHADALRRHGVIPESGWDLFRAFGRWRAAGHEAPPALVLLHGLYYNTAHKDSRTCGEAFSNRDFKLYAANALLAQFPGTTVIFVHTEEDLEFPAPSPTLRCKVTPESRIDNWARSSKFPEHLLSALVCGEVAPAFRYYAPKARALDLLRMVADALRSGRHVLQLAGNRFQLTLRVVETVLASERSAEWPPLPVRALPVRKFYEHQPEQVRVTTYPGLFDWQGPEPPLHLAAYWSSAGIPVAAGSECGTWPLADDEAAPAEDV